MTYSVCGIGLGHYLGIFFLFFFVVCGVGHFLKICCFDNCSIAQIIVLARVLICWLATDPLRLVGWLMCLLLAGTEVC